MPKYYVELAELASVLRHTGKLMHSNGVKALRKTAKYGKKEALTTAKKTRDPYRIKASGEYQNPSRWVIQNTKNGAILSPTAKHALFVERGRRPGKKPPFGRILAWAFQKKIGLRRGASPTTAVSGTARTRRIVKAIQWSIAKHGTKGRWPLKRTMPKIAKRAQMEINKSVRATMGKKPITRKRAKKVK